MGRTVGRNTVVHLTITRWWFETSFLFSSLFGEDEPILTHIFQVGWFNHQPDKNQLRM